MYIHQFTLKLKNLVKARFNVSDYNTEELSLLYKYQDIILDEKICSLEFISSAQETLEKFGEERDLIRVVETQIQKPFHKSKSYDYLINSSIEDLEKTISDLNQDLEYMRRDYKKILNIKKYYENLNSEEKSSFLELAKFMGLFLINDSDFGPHFALDIVYYFHLYTGSVENINMFFNKIEATTYYECFEGFYNRIWGAPDVDLLLTKPDNELNILQKISTLGNFKGISSVINLVADSEAYVRFFQNLADKDVTEENIDEILSTIDSLIIDETFIEESNIGFNKEELKALVSKYKMPTKLLKNAFDEIDSISSEDNIREIVAPGNHDSTPIKLGEFKAKIGSNSKKQYTIELLPKSSPAGLFFGKMTKSCQFYSGNSSDQCVIPVYTDPNTGLIVVRQGSSIKMGSFVWLCKDSDGREAIVLDSIEKAGSELSQIEPEILSQVYQIFSKHNLFVYLGAGGMTSKLSYEIVERSQIGLIPITETYIPYGDSEELYIVTNDTAKILEVKKEELDISVFIAEQCKNLEGEDRDLALELLKTVSVDNLILIKKLVLDKGFEFINILKIYNNYGSSFLSQGIDIAIKYLEAENLDFILTTLRRVEEDTSCEVESLVLCRFSNDDITIFLNKFGTNKQILSQLWNYNFGVETMNLLNSLDDEAKDDFLREFSEDGYNFDTLEKLFPTMQKHAFRFAKYVKSYRCQELSELDKEKLDILYLRLGEIAFSGSLDFDSIKELADASLEDVIKYKPLLEKGFISIRNCSFFEYLDQEIKEFILSHDRVGYAIERSVLNFLFLTEEKNLDKFKKFIEFNTKFPNSSSVLNEKALELNNLPYANLLAKCYVDNNLINFVLTNKENPLLEGFLQKINAGTFVVRYIEDIEADFKEFSEDCHDSYGISMSNVEASPVLLGQAEGGAEDA